MPIRGRPPGSGTSIASKRQNPFAPAHDGLRSDNGYGVKNARTATIEPNEQGTAGPVQMHPGTVKRAASLFCVLLGPTQPATAYQSHAQLWGGHELGQLNWRACAMGVPNADNTNAQIKTEVGLGEIL